MKRQSMKVAVLVLAALLIGTVTGCSQQNQTGSGTTAASTAKVTETQPVSPVTLSVEVFDRALPGLNASDNFQTRWIQENFGTPNNVTMEFVAVPRSEETTKLNIMMAANEAPDICFTYDTPTVLRYGTSGGIYDLGEALKNAPNLTKFLGDKLLEYGRWSGIQYAIPAKRALTAAYSGYIRKDWLDKLVLPVPSNKAQWYDAMKAFKEKDPGKVGTDKVIPFALSINLPGVAQGLIESFITETTEEEFYVLKNGPDWLLPGYKEGYRFLNKLYNEGLVTPNYALDKNEAQYGKDISQGLAGFMYHVLDVPLRSTPGMLTELKKNVPDAELIPVDCFEDYAGKYTKPQDNPNGMYIFVPKTSQRLNEAIKYLDWMAVPENLIYLESGEKGIHYTELSADGIPTGIIPNDKLPDDKKMNPLDIAIICNSKDFGSTEKNVKANSLNYPGFEEIFAKAFDIAMTDTYFKPRFDSIIESEAKYGAALTPIKEEFNVKAITCKPSDFDKTYDELVKKYLSNGGQEIIDERKAAYAKLKK